MSVITAVEHQKKHQGRFNIYLDGRFAFGADEDLVVNQRLIVGKKLDQEELNKLLDEAEVGKWMDKMYNFFSFRMRSEREIRDYFKIKDQKLKIKNGEGISDLVINQVIERLKGKGLINDLEFAKAWVEARRRSKQKGVQALKTELYQKGINKEIVEEVLDHKSWAISEGELARQALEKKMRSWKNLDSQLLKKKAFEFLLRRGFEYDIVKVAVENIFKK